MSETEFFNGYLECALWVGVWVEAEDPEAMETVDARGMDVDPNLLAEMKAECHDFYEANWIHLAAYVALGQNWEQAGHDFFLTRCGHGAGFWDRGAGAIGDQLSDAARVYGDVDLWVAEDGKVLG